MGFLDKAKQMAEQAQTKLDEVQKQFNEQQGSSGSQAPVEYDAHGRPIRSEPPAAPTPPHGDPVAGRPASPPPAPAPGPTEDPAAPAPGLTEDPAAPAPGLTEDPAAPAPGPRDAGDEDRNHPSYAPPKLTGGDPLAG